MLPFRTLALSVLIACILAGGRGEAQEVTEGAEPVAVVELFTSQGCAACPPADILLDTLAARDDVIALAYHVDYWDFIGWRDTFSRPEHTALQRSYVESWGQSRIYTPHMVVNGRRGVVGSDEAEVLALLDRATLPVAIRVERAGETVTVAADGNEETREGIVWLVPYVERADVEVARGENEGRVLSYSHIAGARQPVGVWDPQSGADIRLPLAEALPAAHDGAVILIQEKTGGLPGAIIGAARVTP